MSERGLFFGQFRKNFFQTGSVAPSSRFTAEAMVARLVQKQGSVHVLEVGAGSGAFTGHVVAQLEEGDRFDIIEINPALITHLQQKFDQTPAWRVPGVEVRFFQKDALVLLRELPSDVQYDFIIFSLPLTNFPPDLVQSFLETTIARLKPQGVLSFIKYIFLGRMKALFCNATDQANIADNRRIFRQFISQHQVEQRVILRNIPPTRVHYWQK